MIKFKKHGPDLCYAAWTRTQNHVRDIMTPQIRTRPVKMDEH